MSELKPCEAIEILESIYPSKKQIVTGEYPDVAEALDMAIVTLRRAQPENEPLTLEELREMDGEPVWVITLEDGEDNPPYWAIVDTCGGRRSRGGRLISHILDDHGAYGLYGKTWLAYRYRPEEVQKTDA